MKNHSTTKQPLSLPTKPPAPPPPILITLSISLLLFILQIILFYLQTPIPTSTATSISLLLPGVGFEFFGLPSASAFAFAAAAEENSRNARHSPNNRHHRNHGRISYRSGSGGSNRARGTTSPLLPSPVPWWYIEARDLKPRRPPPPGQLLAEIPGQFRENSSLLLPGLDDKDVDAMSITTNPVKKAQKGMNNERTIPRRKTKEAITKGIGMMDMDQIMNDMGAWSFQKDESLGQNNYDYGHHGNGNNGNTGSDGNTSTTGSDDTHRKVITVVDPTLSTVKIIPDEHHVSAFLNKGILKRFLFLNDKSGNPLSITITPCTSILLWNVKFWPVTENGTQAPEHLKTYRTQRTVTFTEPRARRGIYSIDIRPLHWDSYVHLYGTSHHPEPIRNYFPSDFNHDGFNKLSRKGSPFSDNLDKFYQHSFTQANVDTIDTTTKTGKNAGSHNPLNVPSSEEGFQINSNAGEETIKTSTTGINKPRIWVRRLRGHRLQVKWDTSPINPHLMNYCIVVNTRRDYSSLCSASGERFGVLPPDLMHVTYYGSTNDQNNNFMVDSHDNNSNYQGHSFNDDYYGSQSFSADSPHHKQSHQHRHRHGHGNRRQAENGNRRTRATHEDIVLGCVNKKTSYILNNLQQGRLYYFNVFLRDLSTNVSYPYVRTTLKYQNPKSMANGLRDAKATKVKLSIGSTKPTTLKFNLNKPCNELTMYVMPCGGGSIRYETFHGNRSVYESGEVDSLDIIKIGLPQRGKYFIKISQASKDSTGQARMAEVYVGKKTKRFPLPKLPPITKLSEDESQRNCDSVSIQWWPSPDPRDNEYCIFLKEESRKRVFQFKKPNQCDVERSLKSDPYVTHSLCLQRTLTAETMLLSQKIVGLQPGKTYVVQLILRRHNGKSLSYDLHHVKTQVNCTES